MNTPTRADRKAVVNHLRTAALEKRSQAQKNRLAALADTRPDVSVFLAKMAARQDAMAARLERVAEWVGGEHG